MICLSPKHKLNLVINNLKRDTLKIRECDKSEENLTINTRYRKEMKYSRAYIRQTYGPALKTIIPRHYGVVWSYKKRPAIINCRTCGEPGLVNRVLALRAGSRGFDSHRGHMSEQFFRSNRPGYPHPVSSELENSGIRVAVGDCSVTERRRWRPPYHTGKTVHVHAKHYRHIVDGRTAPGVCGNGSVPLSHSGNVVTRTGIHTNCITDLYNSLVSTLC